MSLFVGMSDGDSTSTTNRFGTTFPGRDLAPLRLERGNFAPRAEPVSRAGNITAQVMGFIAARAIGNCHLSAPIYTVTKTEFSARHISIVKSSPCGRARTDVRIS